MIKNICEYVMTMQQRSWELLFLLVVFPKLCFMDQCFDPDMKVCLIKKKSVMGRQSVAINILMMLSNYLR